MYAFWWYLKMLRSGTLLLKLKGRTAQNKVKKEGWLIPMIVS